MTWTISRRWIKARGAAILAFALACGLLPNASGALGDNTVEKYTVPAGPTPVSYGPCTSNAIPASGGRCKQADYTCTSPEEYCEYCSDPKVQSACTTHSAAKCKPQNQHISNDCGNVWFSMCSPVTGTCSGGKVMAGQNCVRRFAVVAPPEEACP
jgi:hypothetical protein